MSRNIRELIASLGASTKVMAVTQITTTQIWTAPAGVNWAILRAVGAGGGGGGGASNVGNSPSGGGGAGSGAWLWDYWVSLINGNTLDITIGAKGIGGLGGSLSNSGSNGTPGGDTVIITPDFTMTLGGGDNGEGGGTSQGTAGAAGAINFSQDPLGLSAWGLGDGQQGVAGRDDEGPKTGFGLHWMPGADVDPGSANPITAPGGSAGGGASSPFGIGGYGGGQNFSGGQGNPGQNGQGAGAGGGGGGPTGTTTSAAGAAGGDGVDGLVEIFYWV